MFRLVKTVHQFAVNKTVRAYVRTALQLTAILAAALSWFFVLGPLF